MSNLRTYRDEAVVLRVQKLGEADRIVTLLTREHGKVRGVAKGVRRTSSKFGARLEPFGHVELQLHAGRSNLHTITQAQTITAYGRRLVEDYRLYTTATAMVEMADRLTEAEFEPATSQYLLLVGALHSLATRRHPEGLVLDSYLLRAVAVAGWAPSFHDCAQCGRPGPHRAFAPQAGGVVCVECRPPGSASPDPATLDLLGALLSGAWSQAEATDLRTRREASGLVAAFTQWQLERRLRSLALVERA